MEPYEVVAIHTAQPAKNMEMEPLPAERESDDLQRLLE
jgi:hypothetical protein